jgi:hypothetical protein
MNSHLDTYKDGDFILHLSGMSNEDRLEALARYSTLPAFGDKVDSLQSLPEVIPSEYQPTEQKRLDMKSC